MLRQSTDLNLKWKELIKIMLLLLAVKEMHCTKMKFSIKDFFSKCDQIRSFLRTCSHLLKKSLMENFIFCAAMSPFEFQKLFCKRLQRHILDPFKHLRWTLLREQLTALNSSSYQFLQKFSSQMFERGPEYASEVIRYINVIKLLQVR